MVGHEPAAGKSCEWPELSRISNFPCSPCSPSRLSFFSLPFFLPSSSSFDSLDALTTRQGGGGESCSKNKRPCSFFFFLLFLIFGLRYILSLKTSRGIAFLFLKDRRLDFVGKRKAFVSFDRSGIS